jgi:hypothetical protein
VSLDRGKKMKWRPVLRMLKVFCIVLTPCWRRTSELKKRSDRALQIAKRFMTSWPLALKIKATSL